MTGPAPILALDFGGTKLAAAAVSPEGRVLSRVRRPTPLLEGSAGSLREIAAAAHEAAGAAGCAIGDFAACGISFGGPVTRDRRGIVRSMHVRAWEGVPLADALQHELGLTTVLENDANAAAVAETRVGAARGCDDVVYVQASTGIGCGLVLAGALYRGRGQGAELGHLVAVPDGDLCPCGKRGCLETVSAGWAIAQAGQRAFPSLTSVDARVLAAAARAGDPVAAGILDRAFRYLGLAIGTVVNLLDPQRVVVGGGIAGARDLLEPALRRALEEAVVPHLFDPEVLDFALLGDDAPLVGAALLAVDELGVTSTTASPAAR